MKYRNTKAPITKTLSFSNSKMSSMANEATVYKLMLQLYTLQKKAAAQLKELKVSKVQRSQAA